MEEFKQNFSNYLNVSVLSGYNLPNLIVIYQLKITKVFLLVTDYIESSGIYEVIKDLLIENGIEYVEKIYLSDKNNYATLDKILNYKGNLLFNITGGQKIHTFHLLDLFYQRKKKFKDFVVYQNRDELVFIDKNRKVFTKKVKVNLSLSEILSINGFKLIDEPKETIKTIDNKLLFGNLTKLANVDIFLSNSIIRYMIFYYYFKHINLIKNALDIELSDCIEDLDKFNLFLRSYLKNRLIDNNFSIIRHCFKKTSSDYLEFIGRPCCYIDKFSEIFFKNLKDSIDDFVNIINIKKKDLLDSSNLVKSLNRNLNLSFIFKEHFKSFITEKLAKDYKVKFDKLGFNTIWKKGKASSYIIKDIKLKDKNFSWGYFFEDIIFYSINKILLYNSVLKNKIYKIYRNVKIGMQNKESNDLEIDILLQTYSGQLINFECKTFSVENKVLWTGRYIMERVGGPYYRYIFIFPAFKEIFKLNNKNNGFLNKFENIIKRLKDLKQEVYLFDGNLKKFEKFLLQVVK